MPKSQFIKFAFRKSGLFVSFINKKQKAGTLENIYNFLNLKIQ